MASVRQLVDIVSKETGHPHATVRQIARQLQDDDVLPRSAGRTIQQVTPKHVALLLIAICGSRKISEATKTARAYKSLPLLEAPQIGSTPDNLRRLFGIEKSDQGENLTFGAILARLIESKTIKALEGGNVGIGGPEPSGAINSPSLDREWFIFMSLPIRPQPMGTTISLPYATLRQISSRLFGDDDALEEAPEGETPLPLAAQVDQAFYRLMKEKNRDEGEGQ